MLDISSSSSSLCPFVVEIDFFYQEYFQELVCCLLLDVRGKLVIYVSL